MPIRAKKFDGIVLSDGYAVKRNIEQLGMDPFKGAALTLRCGVDLSLADQEAYLHLIEACEKGLIEEKYIDRAVLRILKKKYELGLFDNPYLEENDDLEQYLSCGIQKRLSYEASAQSAVLLKNNGILPISAEKKVALFGIHATSVYYQLGSYTAFRSEHENRSIRQAFEEDIRGSGNTLRRRGLELKGYQKLNFKPHETKKVEFLLGFDQLKIYSPKEVYEVEEAKVTVFVGSNPDLPLTAEFYTE